MRRWNEIDLNANALDHVPDPAIRLNGAPLPNRFVSKHDLEAIISPEAIAKVGTYIATLKCEGEPFPESYRAHLFELF